MTALAWTVIAAIAASSAWCIYRERRADQWAARVIAETTRHEDQAMSLANSGSYQRVVDRIVANEVGRIDREWEAMA